MLKLLPVVITSLILAAISHLCSGRDIETGQYLHKEKLFWIVMAVFMILFVGLRVSYNDTYVYRHSYELVDNSQGILTGIDWKLGSNPGYNIVMRMLKRLGFSVQSYLMFYAVITISIYLWFIRKYSNNLWLSVFFFIAMECFTFPLAAVKQCVAIAFCLVATDRALKKKYILFLFWIALASLFHPYSLMYLIVPFLIFRPWSSKTWLMLGIFGFMGVMSQPLLGTVINVTSMIGEEYDVAEFSGDGINPFRLAVVAVPLAISFISRRIIKAKNDQTNNLFVNLSMLNAEIMFIGLFGTANYFGRLANYFLIFQTISLPWLFTHFEPRSMRFLTVSSVVCYIVYFYYSNVINQHFDSLFSSITLKEYCESFLIGV